MRIFIIVCLLGLSDVASNAQEAQNALPVNNTPRQKIVDDIAGEQATDLLIELRGPSEAVVAFEKITEPSITGPEAEPIVVDPVDAEPAKTDEVESETKSKNPIPLAAFYLSAKQYRELRGGEKHQQLILDYEVATGALEDGADALTENIRLRIGSDYASVTGPKSQKIYDFKLNRFIEIKAATTTESETGTALHFDNTSLYAKAYRNISTVRQATQNGQKRRIQTSKDQEIDSFWLESSMSWAAAKLATPVEIKSTESTMLAVWDGMSVVSVKFEGDPYKDLAYKNTLFAFAHHVWPIHPNILVKFYDYNSPPNALEMISYGPAQPKGQKQRWTLKNREIVNGVFPLPLEALSVVERRPVSPLVYVISEAVENRAMGGMASLATLKTTFLQAKADNDKLSQWLAGQRYNAYSDKCGNDGDDPVCDALAELTEASKFAAIGAIDPKTKTLSDYVGATEMTKFKKSRGTALFTLQPYLDDADTPAFILRTAAMARASMKKSEVEKAGLGAIQADALLKQALAKDPYDPHTYVGLAQVYAANGAYEQSWDIYDVLRAAIPTAGAVPLRVDQAEVKLLTTGPGYFLQK